MKLEPEFIVLNLSKLQGPGQYKISLLDTHNMCELDCKYLSIPAKDDENELYEKAKLAAQKFCQSLVENGVVDVCVKGAGDLIKS